MKNSIVYLNNIRIFGEQFKTNRNYESNGKLLREWSSS